MLELDCSEYYDEVDEESRKLKLLTDASSSATGNSTEQNNTDNRQR
jgi:hypothetical protein